MPKILALDIGLKRTGVAESDELQMMAFPLETVATNELLSYVQDYELKTGIVDLVVGAPKQMDGSLSESAEFIDHWLKKCKAALPHVSVVRIDERFTSKLASQALFDGGMKKSQRSQKGMIDKVAAALILQSYLAQR
jgi:putative Holliday junction resolvase